MSAILIDYNIASKNKDLISTLEKPPEMPKSFACGLVVVIPERIRKSLESLPKGEKRVEYLGSSEFVQSIKKSYYVCYNEKKEICVLGQRCCQDIKEVLPAFSTLPENVLLWVCIPLSESMFSETVKNLADSGFHSPYITDETPLGKNQEGGITLSRKVKDSVHDVNKTLNTITHLLSEKQGESCGMSVCLSAEAVATLKKWPFQGYVKGKNGKKTQKELTGELFVKDVVKKNGKTLYVFDVERGSIESGREEEVDVNATRGSAHSHPKMAYEKYKVDRAWASATDFLGYHSLGENCIFHVVATIEGAYILSFTEYWGKRLKEIDRKFIKKNFEIDYKDPYTPAQFVEKVNGILYNGHPIYKVFFFPWDKAGTVFNVHYPKIEGICLTSQKTVDVYRKIHH